MTVTTLEEMRNSSEIPRQRRETFVLLPFDLSKGGWTPPDPLQGRKPHSIQACLRVLWLSRQLCSSKVVHLLLLYSWIANLSLVS